MKHKFVRITARLSLLAFVIIMVLMLGSCKSKKKTVERKKESVSTLSQNDIITAETLKKDVKTYHISKKKNFSVTPVNNKQSVKVIQGKDTLEFTNAKVNFSAEDIQTTTSDQSQTQTNTRDNSRREQTKTTSEVTKNKESTGTHPALIWGLILAGLVIGIIIYFKKSIPSL